MKAKAVQYLLVSLAMFTACGQDLPIAPAVATISYIGNSAMVITASDGTRVVCDPYGNRYPSGLEPFPKDIVANAVTVSHRHDDHSNSAAIGGSPMILAQGGSWQVGMIRITGYPGREGSPSGTSKIPNTVFVFEIGGARIVHYGDSGMLADPAVVAAVSDADAVIASIDDYVIDLSKLSGHLAAIRARTFIPVHFTVNPDMPWQGAPTLDKYVATLPVGTAIVRLDGKIPVRPGMPVQVAAIRPYNLKRP